VLGGCDLRIAAPAAADGPLLDDLVDGRDPDEPIDHTARSVRLAEVETDDRCHEVELGEGATSPQLRPPTTTSTAAKMSSFFIEIPSCREIVEPLYRADGFLSSLCVNIVLVL
jgi:hypothetical protein